MLSKINYLSYVSQRTLRRKPSAIRELMPLMRLPGMISLGGGLPNASLFPINKLTVNLKDGSDLEISGEMLDKALQYAPSYGLPEFVDWLKNHMEEEHKLKDNIPPWEIIVTTGSQDGLSKTFDLLTNEGDYVITENPTYSGAIASFQPLGCNLLGVDVDQHGLIPSRLESILSSWPNDKPKPRVLYTIPVGQNPSGATLTLERKQKIYELAVTHNLLIIEDDPYYNLQLPTPENPQVKKVPSFLSMDRDGRVIRLDSFSKIVSSGIRIGFVTGPKPLIDLIQVDQQATCLHASGVSQAIMLTILNKWGKEGWNKQMSDVQKLYTERRDALLGYADKHLSGLAEWFVPPAGMFLWFKLHGIEDTLDLIKTKALNEKVLFVPGRSFSPNNEPSPYVRASYSTATFEQMEEAMKRLANLLKKEKEQK